MPQNEDRRSAVQIATTLSQAIMAADLAVLAIVGAAYTQLVSSSAPSPQLRATFGLLTAASMISFVASIFCGGRGIQSACSTGAQGAWSLEISRSWYSAQAGLALVGLLLFLSLLVIFGISLGAERAAFPTAAEQAEDLSRSLNATLDELEKLKRVLDRVDLKTETTTSGANR